MLWQILHLDDVTQPAASVKAATVRWKTGAEFPIENRFWVEKLAVLGAPPVGALSRRSDGVTWFESGY